VLPRVTNAIKRNLPKSTEKRTHIHASTFKHNAVEFSLGEDALKELSGRRTWPSLSPKAWAEVSIGTHLLYEAGRIRCAALIHNSWMALLAIPGWVIQKRLQAGMPRKPVLVCRVTVDGLLAWPVTSVTRGKFAFWQPVVDGKMQAIHINDPEEWVGCKTCPIGPIHVARESHKMGWLMNECEGICVKPDGGPQSLVKLSGLHSFPNLTGPNLASLGMHLKLVKKLADRLRLSVCICYSMESQSLFGPMYYLCVSCVMHRVVV
jgi:hypothetical protein